MTATATATAAAAAATPAAAPATPGSLGGLASNFNSFLTLLMTQLRNQDPTSPMNTDQFTTELVQFTGVQQQINTNTSLSALIQATQGNSLLGAAAMVGQTVEVSNGQLSLQNGAATVQVGGTAGQPVDLTVASPTGAKLRQVTVPAGTAWTWDGKDGNGTPVPDGAYTLSATDPSGAAVPFTAEGTVTAVKRSGTAMKVDLGKLEADLADVQSVGR